MKICIVVDNIDTSAGWGRLATKVAEGFILKGHSVGFVLREGRSEHSYLITNFNDKKYFFVSLFKMRYFFKQYDIVLCYDVFPYGFYTALALVGLKKKFVLNMVGTYSLFSVKNHLKNVCIFWTYKSADYILAISNFIFNKVSESIKLKRYSIIPVGVDTDVFYHSNNSFNGIEEPYIITVGAIKSRKGYHDSISAFGMIASKFPSLKYVIVGRVESKDYFSELKEIIKKYNIEDRVIFLSNISDDNLVKLYSSSELFLLTSITTSNMVEGYGIVYLEAGACGKPVIGSIGTGAEDAIIDNKTGLLVKNKPEIISKAISKILTNPELSKKFGQEGTKRAKELNWNNIADKYLLILKKI